MYTKWSMSVLLFWLSSCVCEPEIEDPGPEDLFVTYVSKMKVDEMINPESDYIVIIGDIQEYISPEEYGVDCYSYYLSTMAWIYTQQKVYDNISCVLQNGDMTWGNREFEWERYKTGASFFEDKIPLLVCTGNHDYDWVETKNGRWIIKDRLSSMINSFFPGKLAKEVICEQYEVNRGENYVAEIYIGDSRINILVLEFAPRKEVVQWAKGIVEKNSDQKYILMTHEMLGNNKLLHSNSYARYHFDGTESTYSTPKEIWEELVYPNDNIICTLCGHNDYFSHLELTNKEGRKVSNILFNLQYQPNGGDGKIMLWEFPKHKTYFKVSIYNTIARIIDKDSEAEFKIEYDK